MEKTAIVIDDDDDIAAVAMAYLERAGFKVFRAVDGLDGVTKVLEIRPTLALVDLMMPKMHGWEVCERLRAEPSLKDLKILVVSSKSFPSDIDQAKQAGADDYLKKPYLKKDLFAKLRELLGPDAAPDPEPPA